MNYNHMKILLFSLFVILFIGIASATDTSNMTTNGTIHQETTFNEKNNKVIEEYNQIENNGKTIKESNNKIDTKTSIINSKSTIDEQLQLKATVTDNRNSKVTGGYVIFKLNGITIKDNKKLTGSTNSLKVYLKDGVAFTSVTADLNMRNAKNITAIYSGSSTYNPSRSNTAEVKIALRNASIVVSSNVKKIKQGQYLTLNAKVYDITNKQRTTKLTQYSDEFVYFKVNGITLKNSTANTLKVKVVNGTAITKYYVPLGLSGITDGKTFTVKNHTILAGYSNKNYYPTATNTSTFQTERSDITINFQKVTIHPLTHKANITANIKDYLGNNVIGPNKLAVKVNGFTLKNANTTRYFTVQNGNINLQNIQIPSYPTYKNVEIVTQDRLAYKSQRNTTTRINLIEEYAEVYLHSSQTVKYKEQAQFDLEVCDINNNYIKDGKINWYIDNKLSKVTNLVNGKSNITINNQTAGQHTIKAEFIKEGYKKGTDYTTLTVEKIKTILYTPNGAYKGSKIYLRAYVESANYDNDEINEGSVTFYMDGNNIGRANVKESRAKLPYTITQSAGTHTVYAQYTGTNYESTTSDVETFEVVTTKEEIQINSYYQVSTPNEYIKQVFVFEDFYRNILNEGTVTAKLNGKTIGTYTLNEGLVTVNIGKKSIGTYTLTVEYTSSHFKTTKYSTKLNVINKVRTEIWLTVYGEEFLQEGPIKQGEYITDDVSVIQYNTINSVSSGKIQVSLDNKVIGIFDLKPLGRAADASGTVRAKIEFNAPQEVGEHTIKYTYIPQNNAYSTSYRQIKINVLDEYEYDNRLNNDDY